MLSTIALFSVILAAVLLSLAYVFGFFRWKSSKNVSQHPPGPVGLPILGSLHMLGDLPHRTLYTLAKEYGPIMHIRLGLVSTSIISSANAAGLFFKHHDLVFSSRKSPEAYNYVSYGRKGLVGSPYGPYWKNIRKLCTLHLLSKAKTEMFNSIRRQEVVHFVESIKTSADSLSEIDITAIIGSLIENIIYRIIFGFKADKSSLGPIIEEAVMLTGIFNISDYVHFLKALDIQGICRRMKNISKEIDAYLEKIINEHEQDAGGLRGQQRDFIDVMISLMNSEDTKLDRDNIKAITLDMVAGGTETSATAIVWTIAELLRHPRVMGLVQEELKNTVGLDRMVEETDLDKLKYLKMVIKESMRLHPVVPLIPRESTANVTVGGYFLPKNSLVLINVWAIGRDIDAWSSNVEEFYPERFFGTEIDALGGNFQFLPFGTGRRTCPGMHLGTTMVEIVVAQLVHCFNLVLPKGMSTDDLDMSEKFGLTMPKSKHLLAIPTYRLQM